MKNILLRFLMVTLLAASVSSAAELRAGPNGGRVLEAAQPLEFLVDADRRVIVSALNDALEPTDALKAERIRITAITPDGRQPVPLERKGNRMVASNPLPEGEGYQIVVQVFPEPDARPENFRIYYQTHTCGGCDLQEYACICGH